MRPMKVLSFLCRILTRLKRIQLSDKETIALECSRRKEDRRIWLTIKGAGKQGHNSI